MEQISAIQPGAGNNMRGKCVVIMQNLGLIRVHVSFVCKQCLNLTRQNGVEFSMCYTSTCLLSNKRFQALFSTKLCSIFSPTMAFCHLIRFLMNMKVE